MILYENIDFAANVKATDYIFTVDENFIHEWSLYAQPNIITVGPTYKKLVLTTASLDEVRIWLDMRILNSKISYSRSYSEYVK